MKQKDQPNLLKATSCLWTICFACIVLPHTLDGRCYRSRSCNSCHQMYNLCMGRQMDTIFQYMTCSSCKEYCMRRCMQLEGNSTSDYQICRHSVPVRYNRRSVGAICKCLRGTPTEGRLPGYKEQSKRPRI